jgi:haloalkane dehalogenase
MQAAAPELSVQEIAAYDAPFPDRRFKAEVRRFPDLAMVEPEMEGGAEAQAALKVWSQD